MSVIPFKAKEITASVKNIIEPTKFEGASTSDAGSPHVFTGAGTMDVTFVDVDFLASGDLEYVGGILTNVGLNTIGMSLNISCSVECDTINRNIHLQQWQNDAEVKGSQNVSKAESNVSKVPFSIDAPFVLAPGDTLNLRLEADGACTVTIYHFSVVLETNQITLPS
jgi:hypothetical protein